MTLEATRIAVELEGLLHLFRNRLIIEPAAEHRGIMRHMRPLHSNWNRRFSGFPTNYFPYASFRGYLYRGRRDAYLKDIIATRLSDNNSQRMTIVNPACVFGRHAADLASRLRHVQVIGTDIDPRWNRIYRITMGWRLPSNYTFVEDNVFDSQIQIKPEAVVFFGGCGAVSDGAIDFAIDSGARYVICRTCCHDNIGGNVSIIRRRSSVNRFFRFKNWAYGRMMVQPKYSGYYFSSRYSPQAYPRSESAKLISTPDEFMSVAEHSADSDICRSIIDLDRCLYLIENGFSVAYQGELFVAEREVPSPSARKT